MAKYRRLVVGFTGAFALLAAPLIRHTLIAHAQGNNHSASLTATSLPADDPNDQPIPGTSDSKNTDSHTQTEATINTDSPSGTQMHASNEGDTGATITINGETTIMPPNSSIQQTLPSNGDGTHHVQMSVEDKNGTTSNSSTSRSSIRISTRESSRVNSTSAQTEGTSMR